MLVLRNNCYHMGVHMKGLEIKVDTDAHNFVAIRFMARVTCGIISILYTNNLISELYYNYFFLMKKNYL